MTARTRPRHGPSTLDVDLVALVLDVADDEQLLLAGDSELAAAAALCSARAPATVVGVEPLRVRLHLS